MRLLMEGALTSSAQQLVAGTTIRNGRECGSDYGTNKADLDRVASEIKGGKFSEATAAALSGLVANR
ncbi:hypothetical protein BSP239C_02361 [Brevibacterium sp. 239c]|nr:hypothetical protein BSP239C_02361 [Brevibacterium sp. 239c]